MVLDSVKEDAGTERLAAALATRLDHRLFEPHVCCFEESARLANLSRHLRTALFPLGRVYSPAGLRTIWRFRQYIVQNQIDVVHSFMTRADIFGVSRRARSTPCRGRNEPAEHRLLVHACV